MAGLGRALVPDYARVSSSDFCFRCAFSRKAGFIEKQSYFFQFCPVHNALASRLELVKPPLSTPGSFGDAVNFRTIWSSQWYVQKTSLFDIVPQPTLRFISEFPVVATHLATAARQPPSW